MSTQKMSDLQNFDDFELKFEPEDEIGAQKPFLQLRDFDQMELDTLYEHYVKGRDGNAESWDIFWSWKCKCDELLPYVYKRWDSENIKIRADTEKLRREMLAKRKQSKKFMEKRSENLKKIYHIKNITMNFYLN